MNSSEELYLKNYTSYGIWEDNEEEEWEDDPMALADARWEALNDR